jgi:prepilin-type N-terminal cleavage/methylation domain-containing protein
MFKRLRRRRKGFTMIELMTVIFLISTLAAIMIPFLKRNVYKAKLTNCKANLKNLSTALQMYNNDNDGMYPDSDLTIITPTYMKVIPTCPQGNTVYSYEHATAPESFTIYCTGNNHSIFGLGNNEPIWSSSIGLYPP